MRYKYIGIEYSIREDFIPIVGIWKGIHEENAFTIGC